MNSRLTGSAAPSSVRSPRAVLDHAPGVSPAIGDWTLSGQVRPIGFRRAFTFDEEWRCRRYRSKQVEAYAVRQSLDRLVITAVVKYFGQAGTCAYLRLRVRTPEAETVRISDAVNVHLAPDATVCGIELLNANEQLHGGDAGKLVLINEAHGDRQEVALGR